MYFSLLVPVIFLLQPYSKTMESTIILPIIDIIACILCICD